MGRLRHDSRAAKANTDPNRTSVANNTNQKDGERQSDILASPDITAPANAANHISPSRPFDLYTCAVAISTTPQRERHPVLHQVARRVMQAPRCQCLTSSREKPSGTAASGFASGSLPARMPPLSTPECFQGSGGKRVWGHVNFLSKENIYRAANGGGGQSEHAQEPIPPRTYKHANPMAPPAPPCAVHHLDHRVEAASKSRYDTMFRRSVQHLRPRRLRARPLWGNPRCAGAKL